MSLNYFIAEVGDIPHCTKCKSVMISVPDPNNEGAAIWRCLKCDPIN